MNEYSIIIKFLQENSPLPYGKHIEHNIDLQPFIGSELHITENRFFGTPAIRNKNLDINTLKIANDE